MIKINVEIVITVKVSLLYKAIPAMIKWSHKRGGRS